MRLDDVLTPALPPKRRPWFLIPGLVAVGLLGGLAMEFRPLAAQDGPTLPGNGADSPQTITAMKPADDGPVGLNGILPEDVPGAISRREWESLPESWQEWADETARRVEDLYSGELSLEKQKRTVARLRVKLGTLDKAIGQWKYRRIDGRLRDLRDGLGFRVDLAEALMSAADVSAAGEQRRFFEHEFNELTRRIVDVRNDMNRVNTGSLWVGYFKLDRLADVARNRDRSDSAAGLIENVISRLDGEGLDDEEQEDFVAGRDSFRVLADQLETLADLIEDPVSDRDALAARLAGVLEVVEDYEDDATGSAAAKIRGMVGRGDRVGAVLANRYLGNNFRGSVSEYLVQTLLSDSRAEKDTINRCVLGARVVGSSFTATDVGVDLRPNPSVAEFVITLNGTVRTNTTGRKSVATVRAVGNHSFHGTKTVVFDGYEFATSPAALGVNINNRITSVTTSIRFPIIRRIAQKKATQLAYQNKPKVDSLTRNEVTDGVRSEFDGSVNSQLASAGAKIDSKLYEPLRRLGLIPTRQSVSTTDTSIDISATVSDPGELSGPTPPSLPLPHGGVAVQFHETYLNAFADRLGVAGRTLSNQQLTELVRSRLSHAFGRDIQLGGRTEKIVSPSNSGAEDGGEGDDRPVEADFVFADEDPIRFKVSNGTVTLILRTGLDLPEDKDDIPTQIVTVPLEIEQVGSQVTVTTGTVGVRPVVAPRGRIAQIARANVIRRKIADSLPVRRINASFSRQLENKTISLTLSSLDVAAGWITATLQ